MRVLIQKHALSMHFYIKKLLIQAAVYEKVRVLKHQLTLMKLVDTEFVSEAVIWRTIRQNLRARGAYMAGISRLQEIEFAVCGQKLLKPAKEASESMMSNIKLGILKKMPRVAKPLKSMMKPRPQELVHSDPTVTTEKVEPV